VNYIDILNEKGVLLLTPKGKSMSPFIKPKSDIVKLIQINKELKKHDVVLYKKDSSYILHRIIKMNSHKFLVKGDNEIHGEWISKSDTIAYMTGLFRKNRYYSNDNIFRIFVRMTWYFIFIFKKMILKIRSKIKRSVK
jgi:hypothetical protein